MQYLVGLGDDQSVIVRRPTPDAPDLAVGDSVVCSWNWSREGSSPMLRCHRIRSSFQYASHSMSVPGSTKNCISICSNSRVRKMKFPGVISFRNAFPICAIPNGIR